MDFNGLVFLPPHSFQFGRQPISQKTNPHMIAHAVGAAMKHRTHLQVGFQVAKRILHLQEILIMAHHPGAGDFLGGGVGAQQIEAIPDRLRLDQVVAAASTAAGLAGPPHTQSICAL